MARYRVRGIVAQKVSNPWPTIIAVIIGLIILGAAIGG